MFQIFIDNEEVVCESEFTISEEFMNPSSIELYKVFPKSWKGTNKLMNIIILKITQSARF